MKSGNPVYRPFSRNLQGFRGAYTDGAGGVHLTGSGSLALQPVRFIATLRIFPLIRFEHHAVHGQSAFAPADPPSFAKPHSAIGIILPANQTYTESLEVPPIYSLCVVIVWLSG